MCSIDYMVIHFILLSFGLYCHNFIWLFFSILSSALPILFSIPYLTEYSGGLCFDASCSFTKYMGKKKKDNGQVYFFEKRNMERCKKKRPSKDPLILYVEA